MPSIAPPYEALPEVDLGFGTALAQNAEFARWVSRNTLAHKVPGYIAVVLSTKPGIAAPPVM